MKTFKCIRVHEENRQFNANVENLSITELPDNEVLIRVEYSSLNYKDALSANGNKGVTREYPHTPGIDASGVVLDSKSELFKEGDKVLVTGYDLGMNTHGGFSELISIPASWLLKLPENLSSKEAMMIGTAGFTAALSVHEIVESLGDRKGNILVSGASGGVGSLSIKLLSMLGFQVTALSSKISAKQYLKDIGASEVILTEDFLANSAKLMLRETYDGMVDTVGGEILATGLKSIKYDGIVSACGNAADFKLNINVYPFILRGVTLKGIDSVLCPMAKRETVWQRLSTEWKLPNLAEGVEEISLDQCLIEIAKMLEGKKTGRSVIKL